MSRLNTQERKSLPSSDFGLPASRQYPIEDAAHARNAKARASEMEHRGVISPAQEAEIDHRADEVLNRNRTQDTRSGKRHA